MSKTALAAALIAAAGLAGCSKAGQTPTPQGSDVAAAMPDTAAPREDNYRMTAPDAGETGTVPANGAPPPVQPTPDVGTAGGSPGVVQPTPSQIEANKPPPPS